MRGLPWIIVALLLSLCAAKGIWFTRGLTVPDDPDTIRDLGFIQGILDGNLAGDPSSGGAWRWYPPLVHAVAAAVIHLFALEPMPAWTQAGGWLNLLSPLMFFLMNRRLLGPWPACAATAVFVLFNSSLMAGDEAAGYTPWTLTPALSWPLFFGAVWLIAARAESAKWRDAVLIGAMMGIVFLCHTVPALLLAAIVTAAVVAAHGLTWGVLLWLAAAAVTELMVAAPFLGPLIWVYHLHIANPVPGAWVHEMMEPAAFFTRTAFLNLPGVLALIWLGVARRSSRVSASTAILGAWVLVCLLFLGRHYVCAAAAPEDGVCHIFVIAPHHYHVYLQAAWASLIGVALGSMRWRPPVLALAGAAALAGAIQFLHRPGADAPWAGAPVQPDAILDQDAYAWILHQTSPGDLFVTPLPEARDQMGAAAATVIAAGRRLAAPPEIHANPYLAWRPLNARRLEWLAAAETGDAASLCHFATAAAPAAAFLLLPSANAAAAGPLRAVLRTRTHTVLRLDGTVCDGATIVALRQTPQTPPESP